MNNKKNLIIGLSGLLWFLAVLLGYAYTHKPFTPEQVLILARVFWQIFIALTIVSVMGALGIKAFPMLQEKLLPLVALGIYTALGLGILGLFIFFLGISIGFSTVIFSVLLLFLAIFLRKEWLIWWRSWRALVPIWEKSTFFEKILAGGIFYILFASLAKSLAPPLAFDSLVYHLTLPKIYLLQGRISYVPELIFWGMPQLQEMGQTFAMALAGAEAAIVFSWALGVIILAAILGYLSGHFSTRAGWVAITSLLAGYTLSDLLSWGYVGWTTMLYGLGIFFLLDLWVKRREDKLLWISAIMFGFAMGTKYTTAILAGAVIFIIFLAHGRREIKLAIRQTLIFGGIAFLIFSPWLIKNLLATGNPFYPLLFPSGAMDVHRLALYQGDPPWGDWRDTILLPWRATIWGLNHKEGYSTEIGSLLLALSAFVWVGWKNHSEAQRKSLISALVITLVGFIIWAVAGRTSRLLIQTRLYLAFFPAWAVLAGVGFDSFANLRASGVRFGRVAAALVLLAFGFNVFVTGMNFTKLRVMETLIGAQTPDHYRERALGTYETAMSTIAELPSSARVLFLWETRGFSCVPQCEPDETIDRWYADLGNYGSPEAVLKFWQDAGYTHLLFFKRGAEFIEENDPAYTPEDWVALAELLTELPILDDFDGSYQLLSLE